MQRKGTLLVIPLPFGRVRKLRTGVGEQVECYCDLQGKGHGLRAEKAAMGTKETLYMEIL